MRFTTNIIAFVFFLAFALRADACFSEGIRQRKMNEYKKLARDLGFKESEINCLLDQGDKYTPKKYIVQGRVFICFHDRDYRRYMVSAMSVCITDMKAASVRKLANGEQTLDEPDMSQRTLRLPVEPSTPMRKVAHWLGLKETVRRSCGCNSGCHYCCVNTGLSGDDLCFRLWCPTYKKDGYCE